jgi:hypothetical protein
MRWRRGQFPGLGSKQDTENGTQMNTDGHRSKGR